MRRPADTREDTLPKIRWSTWFWLVGFVFGMPFCGAMFGATGQTDWLFALGLGALGLGVIGYGEKLEQESRQRTGTARTTATRAWKPVVVGDEVMLASGKRLRVVAIDGETVTYTGVTEGDGTDGF